MIEADQRVLWRERDGTMRDRQRLVDIAPGVKNTGEIGLDQSVHRRQRNGLPRDGECFIEVADIVQRHRKVGMAVRIIGIGCDRPAVAGDRGLRPVLTLQDHAQIGMRLGEIRIELQRAFGGRTRCVELPEIDQADRKIVVDLEVGGIELREPPIDINRVLRPPASCKRSARLRSARASFGSSSITLRV
jgi:hypothetical protein